MDYLGDAMSGDTPVGAMAKSSKEEPAKQDLEVSRVEIEPSHNGGFIVTEYYKAKTGKRGNSMGMVGEPVRKTAADLKELDAMLDECFGMSGAYGEGSEDSSDDEE